jgi:hypothetical protein
MAALHGLISMGLRLNNEAEEVGLAGCKGGAVARRVDSTPAIIRSTWMK